MKGVAKYFLVCGALFGLLAVTAGAGGAHALQPMIAAVAGEARFELAAQYLFFHALALIALALVTTSFPLGRFGIAGWLIVAGVVLFCGSLFVRSVTGWGSILTPIGGSLLILGWLVLLVQAVRFKLGDFNDQVQKSQQDGA